MSSHQVPAEGQGSIAAIHPQRARVSSIFQKANSQDDIDVEMLKHVQFAAQRSSFVGAAVAADASSSISHAASHATSQTKSEAEAEAPSAQKQMQHSQPATEQLQPAVQLPTPVKQETPVPDVKAASAASNDSAPIEDFTLDKIEQSIADIEAELGWISEPVEPVLAPVPEARNASVTTSSTGPLLANKPQAQPAGATISTGFSPNNAPPAVVASRLSFSGTPLLMPDQLAKHSPLIPAGQPLQGLSGGIQQIKPAAAAVPAIPAAPAVPALALSSEKVESESAPWSSRSTEGVHTELLSPRESSAGKVASIKRSVSAKMAGPTTYSARYATRQLSISGIRSPPTAATPERRSFLASPTTSIHGSTVPPAHHSVRTARSSSPLPPLPHPANVLAGAAAALSAQGSHARPSAVEGSGWHMATADGLPFQPKGTLVASSGGSRTLRPITSQQEALFDAEGNLLPREDTARKQLLPESRPQAATTFASSQHNIAHSTLEGKNQAGKASTTGSQTVNAAGSSKEQSKKGMLQLACFCFRPRTRSADDPYPQGSLRDRFAAKSTAAGSAAKADAPVTAASNKASDAFSNAVSSKAANADSNRAAAISSKAGLGASGEMGLKGTGGLPAEGGAAGGLARGETASSDWDLKAEQQQTEAAVAASMQDCEAGSTEVQSSIEALLQGAISLAPKHGITAACSSSDDDATEEADHATSSKEGEDEAHAMPSRGSRSGQISSEAEVNSTVTTEGQVGSLGWAAGTSQSVADDLTMTGRSASSRTVRQHKEWEKPEVDPKMVSSELEAIMAERFPELSPLLLETSFSNKQAPWRQQGKGTGSNSPSRAASLSVSRAGSITQPRPAGRHGPRAVSHLAAEADSGAHVHAQHSIPATEQSQVDQEPAQQLQPVASGWQHEGPDEAVANVGKLDQEGGPGQNGEAGQGQWQNGGLGQGQMLLVEAAALGAASPGAVVRVPTSSVLSQADQIALRYQHQVQFQLQQAMGGNPPPPPPVTRSTSQSPSRQSPTKHRPFHLSDSPWKSLSPDSAPPQTPSDQSRSPTKTRSMSRSPVKTRTAKRNAEQSSLLSSTGQAAATSRRSGSASPVRRGLQHVGSAADADTARGVSTSPRKLAMQQAGSAVGAVGAQGSSSSPGLMSFGSYGGVTFSSIKPEVSQGTRQQQGTGQQHAQRHSDKQPSSTATHHPAHHSSIRLSDLQQQQAQPTASHHNPVSREAGQEADFPLDESAGAIEENPAYLQMLASLAQEGELSSPGHSDEEEVQPKSAFISQPDDGTGLLHADIAARDAASAVQSSSSAADADARGQMSSEVLDSKSEQEAAPLAQALAALVADAQQAQQPGPMAQQAQQSSQMAQQAQRQPHEDAESSAAGADQNEDAESMSSQDSGDLLAEAAAAATAAGLSPRPQPHSDLADAQPQYAGNPVDQDAAASQETSAVPQWSRVKSRQAQHGPQQAKHAVLEDPTVQHAAQQGPKQAKHAMFADQEIEFESQQGMQKQRQSGSGDYIGPASSAPSWSGSAAGVGRFRDKQAINYVGKSARRPQAAVEAPKSPLEKLFSKLPKLGRGGAKGDEDMGPSSRAASMTEPAPAVASSADSTPATRTGSWLPKALQRMSGSQTVRSASGGSPLAVHLQSRLSDDTPASPVQQPDGGDSWQEATSRSTSIHGPLPSQKSTPEIFTALPSVPVPAPIAADPLTAPSSSLQPHPAALAPAVVQAGSTVSTATAVDAGNGHSAAAAGTVKAARQPGVAVTYVNLEVQAGSKTGFDSWNTQSAGGEVTDSRQSASDSDSVDNISELSFD